MTDGAICSAQAATALGNLLTHSNRSLIPFVRKELDRSAGEVIEFVHRRFPEHGPGFLLDEAELVTLDDADHAEYKRRALVTR